MSLNEYIIDDNDDHEWAPDPAVSCSLPDLRPIAFVALGAVVVTLALALWAIIRSRLW